MNRRQRLGAAAERYAAGLLTSKGYRVLARNLRRREGEIDIVALDGACLVFVEVRARRGDAAGSALESLAARKRARLAALAEAFAAEHPELPQERRIDLVAVELDLNGRLRSVVHVENAVTGQDAG